MKLSERIQAVGQLLDDKKDEKTLHVSTRNLKAVHSMANRATAAEEEVLFLRTKVRELRKDLTLVKQKARHTRSEYVERRLGVHDSELAYFYGETREEWEARVSEADRRDSK